MEDGDVSMKSWHTDGDPKMRKSQPRVEEHSREKELHTRKPEG